MDAREDGESTKLPTAGYAYAWRDAVYAARALQTHARGQRASVLDTRRIPASKCTLLGLLLLCPRAAGG